MSNPINHPGGRHFDVHSGGKKAPTPATTASAAALFNKVQAIIVEQLGIDPQEIDPESDFVNDLGADSLDTVELVMAFEEKFDIDITDEDAEKIRTVQDAVNYLLNRRKVKL